ncbi:hypothetical protein BKA65DRAFT_482295 [Rhexocercosporidium sp. MPI-PUGE-AT-0058]|nr:hypothetical protein BKA65DRAFT_482295 [Rhexocercosporidium sp. MPI-PUGE-AT-0058]
MYSSIYPKLVSSSSSQTNQAGSPTAPIVLPPTTPKVSQPMHSTQSSSRSTLHEISQHSQPSSPQNTHTSPINGQMLPSTTAPTLDADAVSQIQNQPPSWVEASLPTVCSFSNSLTLSHQTALLAEKSEIFLKELAHTHALYANPISEEDQGKLCSIFDEFYDKADFGDWKPPKGDEGLWQLFRGKLDRVQTEMLRRGETFKTNDGTIKRAILSTTKALTIDNSTPESLATPPGTPVLGNDKVSEGLELWNGLDVDAQAALFRNQLRSAKNRKGLMLEWNEYCVEIREKRGRAKSRGPKSTTPSARSTGSKSPPVAEPPAFTLPVVVNVKEIIAKKIQELQMKRDRDLLQAFEERASKRPKADPA